MESDRYVIYIGDTLITVTGLPGDQQCTAMTTAKKRCKNPLEYGQIAGWREIVIPGHGRLGAYPSWSGWCETPRVNAGC